VVLGCLAWMFLWWLFEVIPLGVTALLPLILFPALSVATTKAVAASYSAEVIYLFLGGFFLARAIEKWGVHHWLAHRAIGGRPYSAPTVFLIFIGLTAFISMWISNTAAALVVLPLITTISHPNPDFTHRTQLGLKLAVAYAASVGGVATLIGSPPNAIMASVAAEKLGIQIGFLEWMYFGVPMATAGCLALWIYLAFFAFRLPSGQVLSAHQQSDDRSLNRAQQRVLMIFLLTVAAWVGQGFFATSFLSDASIAMIAAIFLFSCPSGIKDGEALLTKEDLLFGGWPVLLLFGGVLALSMGMDQTGLGEKISQSLHGLSSFSPFLVLVLLTGALILLTEVSSNTAVAAIFVPLVLSLAPVVGLSNLTAMMAVTMAGSLSFMLPMATPPNAVVFASGGLKIKDMMKYGLALNLIFWFLVSALVWFLLPLVWKSV